MNNRSPVFCPGCHRLMVLRMRQVEDGQKILTTECFDCGVMFNHSRSLDADEAKIEEEQFPLAEKSEQKAVRPASTRGLGRRRFK
jgi:hypothetical protein